jgi:hypothetical protein
MNGFFFRFKNNKRVIIAQPKMNHDIIKNYNNIKRSTHVMKNRLKEISRIVSHSQNTQTIQLIQEHIYSLELELNRLESEHNISMTKINELYSQIVPSIKEQLISHDTQIISHDNDIKTLYSLIGVNN